MSSSRALVSAARICASSCVVELALRTDRLEDRGAALLELAQVAQPLLERAQLRVVETAGRLLAVAGDERHGRAAVEQPDRGAHLAGGRLKLLRDAQVDGRGRAELGRCVRCRHLSSFQPFPCFGRRTGGRLEA